jgi:hypothetical protein
LDRPLYKRIFAVKPKLALKLSLATSIVAQVSLPKIKRILEKQQTIYWVFLE